MRTLFLYSALLLTSCQLILDRFGPERCSGQEEALCDGEILRSCDANNFVVFDPCELGCLSLSGDDACDVCGNALINDLVLQCDDGKQCEGGAACQEDAECAGQGDGLCLPRDGDDCPADCILPICGDDNVESNKGEVCDDGNTTAGDGCRADCLGLEICGDGQLDPVTGEGCDDKNLDAGDGCDVNCVIEFCGDNVLNNNEECEPPTPNCSATSCTLVVCGNGTLEEGEQCEDNNTLNGDGCSDACQLEGCGNRALDLGEACDDGNTTSGDGCDSDCKPTCDNLAALFQTELNVTDPATGHCYSVSTQAADWNAARANCETLNDNPAGFRGHLVTLTSAREHAFVRSIVFELDFWIGLTDQDNNVALGSKEDSFRWVTEERLSSFIGFAGNEPSDSFPGEDCVHFFPNSLVWNDIDCDSTKFYICEFDFGKQCGNGLVESGEACDDGNQNNDDTCNNACVFNGCNTNTTGAEEVAVNLFSDGCFALYENQVTWDEAQADCKARGGFLATTAISTGAITSENSTADSLVNGSEAWIGLRDSNAEDLFQWVNGEVFDFDNFDGGQPSNSGNNEDCVEMRNNGRWNDFRCSAERGRYLCEF